MTTDQRDQPFLRRLTARDQSGVAAPVTPARALRIALSRAAERAAGLSATALGVGDENLQLEEVLARVDEGWLLLALEGGSGPGLLALDPGLLRAVIERQMLGHLAESEPEARAITATDVALSLPLATALIEELVTAAAGSDLDDWVAGRVPGPRFTDLRAANLALPERSFRTISLSAWLGAGDRQGQVLFALPEAEPPIADADPGARAARWSADLTRNVMGSETPVEAVLHRLTLPLTAIQALQPGQNIPLPGVRVTSVRIEAADGRLIGRGRLGQTGGLRAVRIEAEPPRELLEDPLPTPPPALVSRA